MPTVSRLRTPATDQSCRVVAGASGVGEGEPDGSAGPEVTGSTKAQGGIRGAQLDGGRCFRTGCGRLVGPSRRVGRLVVQCTCIGLATKRFMLAILAAQADRGFLPRYRGRGGNRPWGLVGAETDPETWVISGLETDPEARRKPAPGFCFWACLGDLPRRRSTSWKSMFGMWWRTAGHLPYFRLNVQALRNAWFWLRRRCQETVPTGMEGAEALSAHRQATGLIRAASDQKRGKP